MANGGRPNLVVESAANEQWHGRRERTSLLEACEWGPSLKQRDICKLATSFVRGETRTEAPHVLAEVSLLPREGLIKAKPGK